MSYVADFAFQVVSRCKLHAPFLRGALADLSSDELGELEEYLGHCLAEGSSVEELAEDYKLVVDDTLREQIYFQRHGRYRYARFDEVAATVYGDPRYMRPYMRGLAITEFCWPNHTAIRRYFVRDVLPRGSGAYLEVGPGHGWFFRKALESGRCARCEGVDISASSIALTEGMVRGRFSNYRLREGDFLTAPFDGPFDTFVMGEVLEHVERPGDFLSRARAVTSPAAVLFVTTCINSPAFDHIFLFSSPAHLRGVVAEAGLSVKDELVLPYPGTSLEQSEARKLPVNVALVLGHA